MTTQEVGTFIDAFQTLMMASTTPEGVPHASTAPFVREGNRFYLLISTIAQHGRNLLSMERVSLLFAEDEQGCAQPFARKRVTLDATVSEIGRSTGTFETIIERFKERFDADLVEGLSGMGDFHLFELSVQSGSAVTGFGRAYRLNSHLEVEAQMMGQHGKGK